MSDSQLPNNICLLKGAVHGGKSTFLEMMTELFQKEGITVGGFLCRGFFSKGIRSGFSLRQIGTENQVNMASNQEKAGWLNYRRFWFNPQAFDLGRKWIHESLNKQNKVLLIDEVGPLELEGSGWADTLDELTKEKTSLQLWTVRERLTGKVMERWHIESSRVIDIHRETPENAVVKVMSLIHAAT